MATYLGREGSATFGAAAIAQIKSWSITTGVSLVETTVKGDTHRKSRTGTTSGTASIVARFDYVTGQKAVVDAIVATQTAAELILTTATGKTYTADALVTDHSVTSPEGDGTVEVTFNFELQELPTIAWV